MSDLLVYKHVSTKKMLYYRPPFTNVDVDIKGSPRLYRMFLERVQLVQIVQIIHDFLGKIS